MTSQQPPQRPSLKVRETRFGILPHTLLAPIFDALPIEALLKARLTSRLFNDEFQSYKRITFSDERLYGQFFDQKGDIERFRAVQAECEALVSGSSLTLLLSRSHHQPGDLDVFIRAPFAANMTTLLTSTGFRLPLKQADDGEDDTRSLDPFQPCSTDTSLSDLGNGGNGNTTAYNRDLDAGIQRVLTFVNGQNQKIQLIITRTEPIDVILGFYCTAVLNIATANRIVSLYPNTTFVRKEAVYLKKWTAATLRAKTKYEKRGWTSVSMISAEACTNYYHELSSKIRWLGDRHCWTVDFRPIPGIKDDNYASLTVTSWNIQCPAPDSVQLTRTNMHCDFLKKPLTITRESEKKLWTYLCFGTIEPTSLEQALEGLAIGERTAAVRHEKRLDTKRSRAYGPDSVQDEAVRFLRDLYPVLDDVARKDDILREMFNRFRLTRMTYESAPEKLLQPTGHVVTQILQCIEDVKNTGHCDQPWSLQTMAITS
ncbi:hypothetical protein VNI00_011839 [Paramarasmius palmivorus]|uniref:F-box domain-containing protein n=1 Tax=Paramarasmius palmivorus TaxID=297713 RepID=A0AAW0CA53_9AGAR